MNERGKIGMPLTILLTFGKMMDMKLFFYLASRNLYLLIFSFCK